MNSNNSTKISIWQ